MRDDLVIIDVQEIGDDTTNPAPKLTTAITSTVEFLCLKSRFLFLLDRRPNSY